MNQTLYYLLIGFLFIAMSNLLACQDDSTAENNTTNVTQNWNSANWNNELWQ